MDLHGRTATKPWQMPPQALFAIAKRAAKETSEDNVGLIAAGVAFYGFLALVPLLGAIVLAYGVVADPSTVVRNVTQLTSVMPMDVAKLIGEQLMNVVKTSDGKKGFGILIALGLALFSARSGAGAIITALNVAYEEHEKRSFFRVNLLAVAMTSVAVAVAILALVAITALGHLESLIPGTSPLLAIAGKILAYAVLTLAGAGAAATLYKYGPSRQQARWVWLTPGSLVAALLWLILTIGFGVYVANFGNYGATYGSLGTVVVTLTWLYLSSFILLFGAELNSEFEHQTAKDSTVARAPLGKRGAWAADHVAGDKGQTADISVSAVGNVATTDTNTVTPPGHLPDASARPVSDRVPVARPTAATVAALAFSLLRNGRGATGAVLLGMTAAYVWLGRDRANLFTHTGRRMRSR